MSHFGVRRQSEAATVLQLQHKRPACMANSHALCKRDACAPVLALQSLRSSPCHRNLHHCPVAITVLMFLSFSILLKLLRSVPATASSRLRRSANWDLNIACTSCCCLLGGKSPFAMPPPRYPILPISLEPNRVVS